MLPLWGWDNQRPDERQHPGGRACHIAGGCPDALARQARRVQPLFVLGYSQLSTNGWTIENEQTYGCLHRSIGCQPTKRVAHCQFWAKRDDFSGLRVQFRDSCNYNLRGFNTDFTSTSIHRCQPARQTVQQL